jgi:hypothetical protein
MNCAKLNSDRGLHRNIAKNLFAATCLACLNITAAHADAERNNLLVSTSYYGGSSATVTVGQKLAYQLYDASGNPVMPAPTAVTAIANGAYNNVFRNDTVDSSFGVTSGITLETFNTANNKQTGSYDITGTLAQQGLQLVTSFSSKSELALNVSLDGNAVTFVGYDAAINQLDISNANTIAVVDFTNPTYNFAPNSPRAIGQMNLSDGSLQVIDTNAYSGNNGRGVVLANGEYYLAGNAGNSGKSPKPTNSTLDALSANTGVQMLDPDTATVSGDAYNTAVVGEQVCPMLCPGTGTGNQFGYSVTQYGYKADKTGKDDNFRGMTVFNNTLYVTKGSGSNGIDTVFQVGDTGALATNGAIPTSAPITILPGFSKALADTAGHPFGIWFADSNTLYVADEGDGSATPDSFAGLEKWTFDGQQWNLAYTLTSGLNRGQDYTVHGYLNADGSVATTGTGDGVLRDYTTSTGGLRNITGKVNANGTVTIYAVTSTVSDQSVTGDQGADPNKLVTITDDLSFTTSAQAADESFTEVQTAAYGQVLRGVALIGANQWPKQGRPKPGNGH